MAKALDGRQAVPLEEVVLAQAFQLEGLLNFLERSGVIYKTEVLEELKRLRQKSVRAREKHYERQGGPRRSWKDAVCAVEGVFYTKRVG
jgi:hypothetical protein